MLACVSGSQLPEGGDLRFLVSLVNEPLFFVGLEPATILSIYFMHIEKLPRRQNL